MNGAAGLWDQRSSVQCNFVSYLLLGLGCCEQADHQIRSNVVASITFGALTKLVTRSQTLNQSDPFDSRTKKKHRTDTQSRLCIYLPRTMAERELANGKCGATSACSNPRDVVQAHHGNQRASR
jgi:hypothetical protein